MSEKTGLFTERITLARVASLFVLLAIIIALGYVFIRVMAGFWLPLFLAALLVVIFRPIHEWILDACEGKQKRAAILTTLAILLMVLGPLVWVGAVAVSEAETLFSRSWADDLQEVEARASGLRTRVNLDMPFAAPLKELEDTFYQLQLQHHDDSGEPNLEVDRKLCRQLVDQTDAAIEDLRRLIKASDGDPPVSGEELDLLKQQVRDAHGPILDPDMDITVIDALKCSQRLDQAFLTFRGLKQELLGGRVSAWLIELANPSAAQLQAWQSKAFGYLQQSVLSLTGQTTAFVISVLFGMFVLVIALYYFLIDGPNLIRAAMRLSPLDDKYEEELFAKFANISRAVVLATLLSAVVQAILAGLGYAIVGVRPLFLLTLMTGLLAMVPFVGAAAVWLPISLWIAFVDQAPNATEAGRLIPGIGLAIYGATVVSMADNLIKPWVLHGQSNLHPLLALLSVLGGVKTLGPIGLLVGPMVVSFLQALLNMLNAELGDSSDSSNDDRAVRHKPKSKKKSR